MNKKTIIIFISIVFGVYALLNYYIFLHGLQALALSKPNTTIYIIVFSIIFISYQLSRFLERSPFLKIAEPFIWIGSFWLAAMFYFFLILVFIDLIRLIYLPFGIIFKDWFFSVTDIKLFLAYSSCSIVFILIIGGFMNARHPIVRKLRIGLTKKAPGIERLNIVMVSDIHIGMLIKHKMIARLVKMISSLSPDIILFSGDTIDEVLAPVMKYNLGDPLKKLDAKYGKFAISGNHEFIGGAKKSIAYIESLGIRVLKDEVLKIADAFLPGRKIRS